MPRLPTPLPADAPATVANIRRNARAELDRRRRWAPARDACQAFLAPYIAHGARVAIVGAADRIVRAARDHTPVHASCSIRPLSDASYDLVVGDLLYSQLLAPALG